MTAGHSSVSSLHWLLPIALRKKTVLKLVYARAMAMQKACEAGLLQWLPLSLCRMKKWEEICARVGAEGEVCVAASYNCPGQIVIPVLSEASTKLAD